MAQDTDSLLFHGAVNPFSLVAPLVDLGTGDGNACLQALETATGEVTPEQGLLRRAGDALVGAGRKRGVPNILQRSGRSEPTPGSP